MVAGCNSRAQQSPYAIRGQLTTGFVSFHSSLPYSASFRQLFFQTIGKPSLEFETNLMSIVRNTFRRTSIRFGFVYELFWTVSSSFDSESLYQQILKIFQILETLWNRRHISKRRYSLWFRSRKLSSKIELIALINCFHMFPTTDWFKKSNFQRCITSTDYNRVRSHEITKKNTSIVRRTMSNTIRVSDIVIRGYYVLIKFPFFFVRFVSHSTNDKSS